MDLDFQPHASWRAALRGLTETEIQYILQWAPHYHRSGAIIYYLRECDLPNQDLADDWCARLIGSAVVLARDGHTVITVWRNRRSGLKFIRCKPSRGPSKPGTWCEQAG